MTTDQFVQLIESINHLTTQLAMSTIGIIGLWAGTMLLLIMNKKL